MGHYKIVKWAIPIQWPQLRTTVLYWFPRLVSTWRKGRCFLT